MTKRSRKIFKWFLLGLGILFGIVALGLLLFYVKRDAITKELLLKANNRIGGTLQVADVSIDPLVHFPKTSLTLEEVSLYREKEKDGNISGTPILMLESVSISLDVWELLQSRLELTELTARNGNVYLSKNDGGVWNVQQAFQGPVQKGHDAPRPDPQVKSDSLAESKSRPTSKQRTVTDGPSKKDAGGDTAKDPLGLSVEGLHLTNISVLIDGLPDSQQQRFKIRESNAAFKFVMDSLEVNLDGEFEIDRVGLNSRYELEDERLGISIDFFFDRGDQLLHLYEGDLLFRNARFDIVGRVDFRKGGTASLRYAVADDQLQFTRLFLSSEGFENLKSGQLHLRGTIEGPFKEQLPRIVCEFGASDLHLEMPGSRNFVRDLNLSGYFESGNQADLSEATLRLDTIHAVLPQGYIHASSTIRNLKQPEVAYDLNASLRLENLDRFFDLGSLDSLAGKIDIKDTYTGAAGGRLGLKEDQRAEPFTIAMEGVSFRIPEILDIQNMSGRLSGTLDSLLVDTLDLRSGESDLSLAGSVSGLSGLIIPAEEPVRADVVLHSGLFDFPRIFKSLPRTAAAFPYTLSGLDMDVEAEIQVSGIDTIRFVPEMHYEIRKASGLINGLLPAVTVNNGRFHTLEKDGSYLLDFEGFGLEVQGYTAQVGLGYFGGDQGPNSMAISMQTDRLNPGRVFYGDTDSIPGLLDAEISGQYKALLQLPKEEGVVIQSVHLGAENVQYKGGDTLNMRELSLKTNAIAYQSKQKDSLLQTLSVEGDLFLREVTSPRFQTDSLEVFIKASEGAFTFVPRNYLGKGKDDFGTIVMEPFRSPPRYDVSYRINKLRLEEFLESFMEEEALTGEVDLQIQLAAQGRTREEIAGSLFGSVLLEGEDLTLKGIDLDEVITNFSRSQSFNFVDLGAVLLTGPVGVVYTKGFDYVNLVTSGTGDSSRITRFSSRWDVGRGRISSRDVAFATTKHRMAGKGWLSTRLDSLDMTLAVVDKRGCAIIDQRVYGNSKTPEYSKLNVIETLLAPVTDAVGNFLGIDCKVFYDGVVQHPVEMKK